MSDQEIRYRHIRKLDENGKPEGKGGCTIAYKQLDENTFNIAMAVCSDKDTFSRVKGRLIAGGRVGGKKSVTFTSNWTTFHDKLSGYYDYDAFMADLDALEGESC